ncbi:PREDICTED: fasciclin-like arabinogalactan protein 7 [Ipomoea nil]|uniref:fasciclin-like arabinogalactan protein 7 n=1 Tax=Ipomoea nil TaxID=35883 RepID=UPI00090139C2|nr:PREDICTED: fasciclin-like arabinogalactan protein 7 [Ipomoea nil]
MDYTFVFVIASLMIFSCSMPAVNAQSISLSPAPAPAPDFVNLTDLLSVAGPFHTFLNYIETTKVVETFQNQANDTKEGLTLFVPKDDAFSKKTKQALSNLTADQLKSVFLYHALPHYYSLSDLRNLSQVGPISTFAGGQLSALNFTDVSGTVHLNSGWTSTKISSAVHATYPVAIYQVDKVLLPEAIFGTDIPPTPAPAPSPDIAPAADAPASDKGISGDSTSPTSSPPSSSHKIMSSSPLNLILAIVGGSAAFFL